MSSLLRVFWVVLMVLWGGGLWAAYRRRRLVTEADVERSQRWRDALTGATPPGDAVLTSLDLALREGWSLLPEEPGEEPLPPPAGKQ